jgi:hypothetical protein
MGPVESRGTFSGYEIVSTVFTGGSNRVRTEIQCPAGKSVMSGGLYPRTVTLTPVSQGAITVMGSAPTQDQHGWRVDAVISSTGVMVDVYAICANIQL